MNSLIGAIVVLLSFSFISIDKSSASEQGNTEKMYQSGCQALTAKDFPKDKTTDQKMLDGFPVVEFTHNCEVRAQRYLKNPMSEGAKEKAKEEAKEEDRYLVGLIQETCLGPVTPDLYKNQKDWVKNRIGCIQSMLETSPLAEHQSLANYVSTLPQSRKPSSIENSRDMLHRFEHQLNLHLYSKAE